MCAILVLFVLGVLAALWASFFVIGGIVGLVPWIVVGLLAGAIASSITRSSHGVLGDILIGWAGAFIGGALFSIIFHVTVRGTFSLERLLSATVGAILLLLIMKAIWGPPSYYR